MSPLSGITNLFYFKGAFLNLQMFRSINLDQRIACSKYKSIRLTTANLSLLKLKVFPSQKCKSIPVRIASPSLSTAHLSLLELQVQSCQNSKSIPIRTASISRLELQIYFYQNCKSFHIRTANIFLLELQTYPY